MRPASVSPGSRLVGRENALQIPVETPGQCDTLDLALVVELSHSLLISRTSVSDRTTQ